jgi:hypothetical protein
VVMVVGGGERCWMEAEEKVASDQVTGIGLVIPGRWEGGFLARASPILHSGSEHVQCPGRRSLPLSLSPSLSLERVYGG